MELFTAGDRSQIEVIKRWIDQSDVYMLILGGRYGSIEETSGLSYTEIEYDYAVSTGKPLFAVVINDDALEAKVRSHGTDFMEKIQPHLLKAFRAKVLGNISSFFSDEKDIRLCVHESLSDFSQDPNLKGWISGGEIEDTGILHDEIRTLRAENETLKSQVYQAEKLASSKPRADRDKQINDAIKAITNKKIPIPKGIGGDEIKEQDLFSLFYNNKSLLIAGITNQHGINAAESFLYYKLCPELQVYGIISNEKVTGVRYRRSFVTQFGMELLAECDRRVLQLESKK